MIKVNFEDILNLKDSRGKQANIATIINIVDLNNMFCNTLSNSASVLSKDSEINKWLHLRLMAMNESNYRELGHMFKTLDCLMKYAVNKKRVPEYSALVIPYMIIEAYRTYKPLISPLSITMPATKTLVNSDEFMYKLWIDYNNDPTKNTYKFGIGRIPNLEAERLVFGIAVEEDGELTKDDINLVKSIMYGQVVSILKNEHRKLISIKEHENEQLLCSIKRNESVISSRDKRIKKLEQEIVNLNNSKEAPVVKQEVVINGDYYKDEFDRVQSDNFELEKKLSALQHRVHLMEKIISVDGNNTEDKIEEEELTEINEAADADISNYKILVISDSKRCVGSKFRVLDYNSRTVSLTACDPADVVVCMIHYISHPAYYGVKNYCKLHGIQLVHCNANTSDVKKFDESIRQVVVSCLIK